ncbi:MAG: CBS domain-containing protein [Candidatus Thermoplasmatota archaeon]|nr:CBS domain-containing protein [Candidatus Thermoplasmatota archaeon]
MKTSFRLGSIRGIAIRVHFTLLIIVALFSWAFATQSVALLSFTIGFGNLSAHLWLRAVLGTVLAVLFFACVLVHELAHSLMAQRQGYGVRSITLFVFGGISQMEEIPREPRLELQVAGIGPLTSVALGALLYLGYTLLQTANGPLMHEALATGLGTLAFYNFVLGLFNLVPAFPTDGGRLLRAMLATFMDYDRATHAAAAVGKGLAIAMAVFGIFYNFWLILIAVFIYMGASEEERAVRVTLALEGLKARDIMTAQVKTVPPDMSISALAGRMLQDKHTGYPVEREGKVLGVVTFSDVRAVSPEQRDTTRVSDVMSTSLISVSPRSSAVDAFRRLQRANVGRVLVMEDGRLAGIITRSDLLQVIQMRGAGVQ